MGIAADVVEDLFRSGEGCFGVDDPFLVSQRLKIALEGIAFTQVLQGREELEFTELQLCGVRVSVAEKGPAYTAICPHN
jgi:hypothetical protein